MPGHRLDLPDKCTRFSLSQKYHPLHIKGAAAVKPGIKSVVSRSNLLSCLEEKSQGQAVNAANGLGWAGWDILLPEVREGALACVRDTVLTPWGLVQRGGPSTPSPTTIQRESL